MKKLNVTVRRMTVYNSSNEVLELFYHVKKWRKIK